MLVLSQVLAVAIFAAMMTAVIIGKVRRFIPALIGAALTIAVVFLIVLKSPQTAWSILNLELIGQARFWIPGQHLQESHGINWQTVIFIGGMMIMVESMGEVGFFNWLGLHAARIARYKVISILVIFMLLSGFLAMFIDSITVLLFMAAITIELARLLKFDPVPVIIAMIFAANIGGSATLAGDPPNIIIGTALGYSFTDFIVSTGPIAWAGILAALGFLYFSLRKSLAHRPEASALPVTYPEPKKAITDPVLFRADVVIFLLVIALLITHAQTGLSVALIGLIGASLTLGTALKRAPHIIRKVDWQTLLFFIGLFVCVAALEETGVLKILAGYIAQVSGSNVLVAITIILWFSAFISAMVDNIPFAAAMVPVISNLSQTTGIALPTMAWALTLGTDIGGNATPIGASANVIGIAIAEREGFKIGWWRYLKVGLPAMVLVVALSWLILIARYA